MRSLPIYGSQHRDQLKDYRGNIYYFAKLLIFFIVSIALWNSNILCDGIGMEIKTQEIKYFETRISIA